MKRWLIIIVACAVVVMVAAAILPFMQPRWSAGPEAANRQFFEFLRADKLYDAYRSSAAVVQTLTFERFEGALARVKLDKFKSAEWMPPRIAANEATFQGAVEDTSGGKEAVTVNLVRETGSWKVYSLVSERLGKVFEGGSSRFEEEEIEVEQPAAVPTEAELQAMTKETVLKFNEAIQIKYFAPFYQYISQAWQQQTTPQQLEEAFKVFIERGISFAGVAREQAVFSEPPRINEDGLLLANGYFPNKPYRVYFDLKFTYEKPRWRVFGISVELLKTEE